MAQTELRTNQEITKGINFIKNTITLLLSNKLDLADKEIRKAGKIFKAANSPEHTSICMSLIALINYLTNPSSYKDALSMLYESGQLAGYSKSNTAELFKEFALAEISYGNNDTDLALCHYNNAKNYGIITTDEYEVLSYVISRIKQIKKDKTYTFPPTSDPLVSLVKIGRSITAQTDIDILLRVIAEETKIALQADRCTVFLLDKEKDELWSKVALGMNSKEIRFPANQGLAGHVITTGETLNIQNAYESEYFNSEIDKQTGYHTQSILCMPIRNLDHKIIGVFQILNKQGGKYFTNEDEDLLVAIGSSASIALENANLFAKQLQMIEEQQKSFTSFINTLATSLDARDKITAGHSLRVTQYTSIIAKEMGFDDDKIDAFEKAALLHDIGKIGVQDNVLFKEGRLTDEEYKHIQKHAEITSEILNQMYFTEKLKDVPQIASSHHERYDGKGYFNHIGGDNIHIGGRILAVSDVFDAITSKRHYRDRMEISNVLKILQEGAGSHFDPKVIDVFFNVTVDKILAILITAYKRELSEEDISYFSNYTIMDLYKAASQFPESRTPDQSRLVKNFNKLYLNEN